MSTTLMLVNKDGGKNFRVHLALSLASETQFNFRVGCGRSR